MSRVVPVDNEILDGLTQLAPDGIDGPGHQAELRARQAMLAAVAARRWGGWRARLMWRPAHAGRLMAKVAALAATAVAVIGWSAPAGTLLHGVRLARETIARTLPGANRLDVDLGVAEQYLAEAARNEAPADSESEARLFLDDARGLLPPNRNDPLSLRWQNDENALAALTAPPSAPVGTAPHRTPTPKPTASGEEAGETDHGSGPGDDGDTRASPRPSVGVTPTPSPSVGVTPTPTPTPDH